MIRENPNNSDIAIDASLDDQQLLEHVLAFYQRRLQQYAPAQAYVQEHGLDDAELVERYGLGFADREFAKQLPSKVVKAGRELRERLTQLGILRSTGHGHFNGCVVVPIRDAEGHIVDIRGRKITKKLRQGTPLDMRLPGANGVAIEDDTLARIINQLQGNETVNGNFPPNGDRRESSANGGPTKDRAPSVAIEPSAANKTSKDDLDIEQTDNEVVIYLDDRRWRVRGLEKAAELRPAESQPPGLASGASSRGHVRPLFIPGTAPPS